MNCNDACSWVILAVFLGISALNIACVEGASVVGSEKSIKARQNEVSSYCRVPGGCGRRDGLLASLLG
uniref:Secreted protein n=1 Tax=Phakopsora pachyrhizi TaxID=170000 RepID=A0A0S1MJS8_PHAPC